MTRAAVNTLLNGHKSLLLITEEKERGALS